MRSFSGRRWKKRAANRSGRVLPKSTAAPASYRATFLSARRRGATALVIDDLISTGNTLVRAARAARQAGARRVLAMVTHGLFMPGAEKAIGDPALDRLVVTDAVPAFRLDFEAALEKIEVLPAALLLAELDSPAARRVAPSSTSSSSEQRIKPRSHRPSTSRR